MEPMLYEIGWCWA